MPIRISQISFHNGLAQRYGILRVYARNNYSILICIAARFFILCMFTMPCPARSFNAKLFPHFSTSWRILREASVPSTTKIGRRFCRQGISKAPSSYDLHKSVFSCISAKSSMQSFFHARSCADSVFMHLFLHIFSCNACQSVSLCISLCSLEHCFTASTRNMSDKSKKHKNKSVHFLWPVGQFFLFRTSMCLLHMVWDFAPACASCTWSEISPVSRIPIFRLSYSIQEQLQHSGCVTASWVVQFPA